MQFSARTSELYMEFAAPESTAAGNEYTLCGWPVRRAETAGARYHTLIAGDITTLPADARLRLTKALSALFSEYLAGTKRVLVCGLGNRELAADRLGYGVCSRLSLCGPLPDGRALYSFVPG
ncbi:MAG: hypothetical protein IJX14_02365, partial [Clostridia bacterium]|nr:hypothetical protein [Clostridia bacterium]